MNDEWIKDFEQYLNETQLDFYDYSYILEAFLVILRHSQKFFESDETNVVDAKEIAIEIKNVASAIERFLDYDYCHKEYDALEEEHGQIEMVWKPYDEEHHEFDGFCFTNTEDQEVALAEWNRIRAKEERLRNADWGFIFDYMKEKMQSWWD